MALEVVVEVFHQHRWKFGTGVHQVQEVKGGLAGAGHLHLAMRCSVGSLAVEGSDIVEILPEAQG